MASAPQENLNQHPRVAELVARFRDIGERSMRELPVYHDVLDVEAVGFRRVGDSLVGVLITPWFMNLVILPEHKQPMQLEAVGSHQEAELPSGSWRFSVGGDRVVGRYLGLSLHSPMFDFKNPDLARLEAVKQLRGFFSPPQPDESVTPQAEETSAQSVDQSRRRFLGAGARV